MWLIICEHSLGWFNFSKVLLSKCLLHICHVKYCIRCHFKFPRGVYCSMVMHPKALFWKLSFFKIEDQNLLSWARSVLTLERRSYQILVRYCSSLWLRAQETSFGYGLERNEVELWFFICNAFRIKFNDCMPILKF